MLGSPPPPSILLASHIAKSLIQPGFKDNTSSLGKRQGRPVGWLQTPQTHGSEQPSWKSCSSQGRCPMPQPREGVCSPPKARETSGSQASDRSSPSNRFCDSSDHKLSPLYTYIRLLKLHWRAAKLRQNLRVGLKKPPALCYSL